MGGPFGGLGEQQARLMDKHLGTQFRQRQVQIVTALGQTFREMPNWTFRQWCKFAGRITGDVLTTKGAGAAAKTGFRIVTTELRHVQTITKLTGGVRQAVPVYGRFTMVGAKIPFMDVRTRKNSSCILVGIGRRPRRRYTPSKRHRVAFGSTGKQSS